MQAQRSYYYNSQKDYDVDLQREYRRRATKNKQVKKKELSLREKKMSLLALTLATVLVLSVVLGNAVSSSIAYRNSEIKIENKELERDIQDIDLEIQSSKNLGKIENIAKRKLGMNFPSGNQFVKLSKPKNINKNMLAKGDL